MRRLSAIALACSLLLLSASSAFAVTKTVVLGSTWLSTPSAANQSPGVATGITSDNFSGSGCWYKPLGNPTKFEIYLDPVALFGNSFTIGQIASLSYHTRNTGNPSGVDFYPIIYTLPYAGGDASWYGRRIQGEPYLANAYAPSTTAWNTWTTAAGPNQLTLFDVNHNSGAYGWYGSPTLADLQAGPFTWSTWPGAPAGSDATPFDYRPLTVGSLSFQTGGAWTAAFAGKLDAISIALTNGDIYNVELEGSPDNAVTPQAPVSCLTPATPCVTVPVNITRSSMTGIRGYSVTVQMSSNLSLCTGSTGDITQGTYLSSVGGSQYQVVDNGDHTYTIDCAILGATSGATAATGNLFNLSLTKTAGDGTGTVTVTDVTLRDPSNAALLGSAGAPANVTIDYTAPAAPAALTATQVKTGNDQDGTTKVLLTFTQPPSTTVEVYRAGYGHYPEYNDAGGAVPATPTHAVLGPWTLTGVTASGQFDEPATRDYWYYVAFATDACGNVSVASNKTTGTLDYHLGDVVDDLHGVSVGDNLVSTADVSRLAAHYGISIALNDPYNYLDVGPTADYSVNTLPTTDNKIGFEDLMMFAINYGVVSAPQSVARPAAADQDAISLDVPQLPAPGETFAVAVRMKGTGTVQGASVHVAYDAAVVEPAGVEAGSLLQSQGRGAVALSPEPGTVDFALLGSGSGLAGDGEVARMLFRVRAAGAPGITLGNVVARDQQNQVVALGQLASGNGLQQPARTELGPAFPNPAVHVASLQLSLAREGNVKVALYDLAGRRIRTLVDGVQPAGVRILTWNGKNDAGVRMAPGVYVIRLETAGATQSRRLQFLP